MLLIYRGQTDKFIFLTFPDFFLIRLQDEYIALQSDMKTTIEESRLDYNTVVLFFFAEERDLQAGRFAIHRAIKEEGIPA